MSDDAGTPLPSAEPDDDDEEVEAPEDAASEAPEETARPVSTAPPRPAFKLSTFLYVFLGMLGLWMLIDTNARNQIGGALGTSPVHSGPLYLAIGFSSNYLLLTMALAGAVEMLVTALAYNFTTDWVKAAKIQKWSSAFRKVQMEAVRSGKKDRIAALKPHQERLTRLSSEVSIAQFKGMAITYFLLILIYTWVGLVIADANVVQQTISLGGTIIDLTCNVEGSSCHSGGLPIPWWFLIFSLYTVPFSMIFRRILKHVWLRRYVQKQGLSGLAGGSA